GGAASHGSRPGTRPAVSFRKGPEETLEAIPDEAVGRRRLRAGRGRDVGRGTGADTRAAGGGGRRVRGGPGGGGAGPGLRAPASSGRVGARKRAQPEDRA